MAKRPIAKKPVIKVPDGWTDEEGARHTSLSIKRVSNGFIIYDAPYGEGSPPTVFRDEDEMFAFIKQWIVEVK